MPAQKISLWERGLVRPSMVADLEVLDAATLDHWETYEERELQPDGMPHVLVNGVHAVRDGDDTGAQADDMLRAR